MPIYEYKCNKCKNIFEELVFNTKENKIPCLKCGSDNTIKIMSAGNIGKSIGKELSCASSCASPGSACCPSGGSCPIK